MRRHDGGRHHDPGRRRQDAVDVRLGRGDGVRRPPARLGSQGPAGSLSLPPRAALLLVASAKRPARWGLLLPVPALADRDRGAQGLFAGLPQRVGFLGGSSAVFFIVYEFVRGTLTDGITIDPM